MFNPLKKIAMEDKKQQSCGEMDIKLKVTRRPRRFKPGSELTEKVNLVSMEVIQEINEELEELTFMVKLGCTKQEK